ncbi:hypothetical protein BX661DRAFT_198254 [Kickxella alabastrina]|uniref:uncharacterized protein n=1 Tax=Kickxella alabastrina TaxID=61397 RepID=UPI002220AB98|nr:uncharacterized protein BX661DRAFT_198254 [Kickxella alabastrina]KAI7828470.1 hypothetical protein BX661DRAFT_198254 [Kickxella alabastrina]
MVALAQLRLGQTWLVNTGAESHRHLPHKTQIRKRSLRLDTSSGTPVYSVLAAVSLALVSIATSAGISLVRKRKRRQRMRRRFFVYSLHAEAKNNASFKRCLGPNPPEYRRTRLEPPQLRLDRSC